MKSFLKNHSFIFNPLLFPVPYLRDRVAAPLRCQTVPSPAWCLYPIGNCLSPPSGACGSRVATGSSAWGHAPSPGHQVGESSGFTGQRAGRSKTCTRDLEAPEAPLYSAKAHREIINCIDGVGGLGIGQGAPEIVTGSRDGTVKVWDSRQKDLPVANMEPAEGASRRDCWTVAFGHACTRWDRCVCAGYDNGDIKLFDLRNMAVRWETNIRSGVCCVEFDGKDTSLNKLVATTLEGRIHVFNMQKFHTNKGFTCQSEKPYKFTAWTVRHLPQNRNIFVTSGGAGCLHLWKHSESPTLLERTDHEREDKESTGATSLLNSISLSSQPIGSLDWNADKQGLCISASFDHNVHILIVADQKNF
ncbi:dynein axonemal assembly factor 10-like isoform X3 [Heptranchias perlo]|uniref:dynein axonemal assembly factor 10-like isoform X3 n=1 Tax=Heptranchias perlo TaxID=212740 RepID=UPI00355A2F0D